METEKKELILTASENPIDPEPGIYEDVPFEQYQAWNCFSKSMTKAAFKSGAHLDHYIHNKKETSYMALGSLVDCLVLEPHLFEKKFAIQPATYKTEKTTGRGDKKQTVIEEKPWNLRSNKCKEILEVIQASGKQMVSEADLDKAQRMRAALLENAEAAVSITGGKHQVSICWLDPRSGVKCKGRIDIQNKTSLDDLKTTIDASPDGFQKTIGSQLYHVQAGAYCEGWEILTGETLPFRFIVVETSEDTPTPAVALYELDSTSVVAGKLMFHRALANVAHWLKTGVRGYSEFFEPIEAPYWLVNKELSITDEEVEL